MLHPPCSVPTSIGDCSPHVVLLLDHVAFHMNRGPTRPTASTRSTRFSWVLFGPSHCLTRRRLSFSRCSTSLSACTHVNTASQLPFVSQVVECASAPRERTDLASSGTGTDISDSVVDPRMGRDCANRSLDRPHLILSRRSTSSHPHHLPISSVRTVSWVSDDHMLRWRHRARLGSVTRQE